MVVLDFIAVDKKKLFSFFELVDPIWVDSNSLAGQ